MLKAKPEIDVAGESLNITEINREFRAVAAANNWQAYHNPKNLAAAVSVEASELLAEFQWLTPEDSCALNEQQKAKVADEIADVIMYLTELSRRLNINMADAVRTKIEKNKQRIQING